MYSDFVVAQLFKLVKLRLVIFVYMKTKFK